MESAALFLSADSARYLVGISVGIGDNQWQKRQQIQMIMEKGDCRPGDVDYRFLSHPRARPVDHLVATHHGARFASGRTAIPAPVSGASFLLLSYGNRNVYRHPHLDALNLHTSVGWANQISTARNGILSRGDREVD
jgi:hypothetical protein